MRFHQGALLSLLARYRSGRSTQLRGSPALLDPISFSGSNGISAKCYIQRHTLAT
jgi:hypothetical protein